MLLSSSIIVNKLSGRFLYDLTGKLDDTLQFSRPVFLTSGQLPQNGEILVGRFRRNEDIPKNKLHSILITQGRILENVHDKFDCILNFDETVDLYEVVNFIHSVFDTYDQWQTDIILLAQKGCTLTELLDRSQTIFTNPLMIHNREFHFISYSSIIDASPKLSVLLTHSTSPEILNNFLVDKEFQDTFSEKKAQMFSAHITGIRTIYKNIFSHDKLLCRVLICETIRNLEGSDIPLLEILSEQIRYILLKDSDADEQPVQTLNNILCHLLQGDNVDDYVFTNTMESFGWIPQNQYFCIRFKVDHIDVQNHTGPAMVEYLERAVKNSCVFELYNDLIMFVNLSLSSLSQEEIVDKLKEFIRDRNLKAGISLSYHGFNQVFQYLYKQSSITLDVGLRYSPFKWIHRFSEVSSHYLLERCISELPAQMVCSPQILELYQYDQEHGSEYLHTLKTYLENNMQPVATAKKLFIHRTTFLYRLDKMNSMFHLHMDDPSQRILYHISILLLEQASHSGM